MTAPAQDITEIAAGLSVTVERSAPEQTSPEVPVRPSSPQRVLIIGWGMVAVTSMGYRDLSFWPIWSKVLTIGKRPVKTWGLVELDSSVVWSNTMGSVLCVTRSGEGGTRAQKEAIRIAKDRANPLVFLYVADSSFLNKLAARVVVDIKGILESMGRFPLYAAIERALAENVEAESPVRYGVLRGVLPNVVSEIDATTIIIGHLTGDPSRFERAQMNKVLVSTRE